MIPYHWPLYNEISWCSDFLCRRLRIRQRISWNCITMWYVLYYATHWNRCTWWRHQMKIFFTLRAICEGNHRSPVDSPRKGQWRGALMYPLICAWTNDWETNQDTGDLRRSLAHYYVTVMITICGGKLLLETRLAYAIMLVSEVLAPKRR